MFQRQVSKKDAHELEVFRAFVAASNLPVAAESIQHSCEGTNEPDILCSIRGVDEYFELSEVHWETPKRRGQTLTKGYHMSDEAAKSKANLIAKGRIAEADAIVTAGQFGYPPLESLAQSFERKIGKKYSLNNRPFSLLLYYDHQSPYEPYDWLFGCWDIIEQLLSSALFKVVWIYHHAAANPISLKLSPSVLVSGPVPLSSFSTYEKERAVVGRVALRKECLSMSFDMSYIKTFHSAVEGLNAARRNFDNR